MSLIARDVSFAYDGSPVLSGATLEVRSGEVLGVVGPNGAGKSTLVRLLSGVARPSRGAVELDGFRLDTLGRRNIARNVAVARQGGELPEGFLVEEIVAMGRSPHQRLLAPDSPADRAAILSAMASTGVLELRSRDVSRLSGGERQRVVLARALAQEPRYLLLDEPTAHLDLRHQVEVMRRVREQARAGLGVLVVLHDLNLALRGCDRVAVVHHGVIEAEGAPAEVLRSALIDRVYGVELEPEHGVAGAIVPRI